MDKVGDFALHGLRFALVGVESGDCEHQIPIGHHALASRHALPDPLEINCHNYPLVDVPIRVGFDRRHSHSVMTLIDKILFLDY